MDRNFYDLSAQAHACGKLGHLQTLKVMQVCAGDSMEISMEGIFRLSPLRKEIVMDCKIDIAVFYIPNRHIYGDDWQNFIRQGADETVTFTGVANADTDFSLEYLGLPNAPASVNRALAEGYDEILYRYFWQHDIVTPAVGTIPTAGDEREFGKTVQRLPHPITTHVDNVAGSDASSGVDASDYQVASASVLDIRALDQIKGRYKSELQRKWFDQNYDDILKSGWKGGASVDADQRPTLIWRDSQWASGYDVDGTDDATLGSYIGKTMVPISFKMPRKYFPEHGRLWFVCVPRFPFVHVNESHYFDQNVNLSYLDLACDSNLVSREPPVAFDSSRYITTGTSVAGQEEPFGQWYRHEPNRIHGRFRNIQGYPFVTTNSTTDMHKAALGEYDSYFAQSALGHWQVHSKIKNVCLRSCPTPEQSIFAGV
jgi:hypothetical protein